MDKEIKIWEPVELDKKWEQTNTSIFNDLAPSWYKKREQFKNSETTYSNFLDRLKRQHAIETGVVEKLYDLNEGVTQTLIKEGFIVSYINHTDTNISPNKLINHLDDHLEAIESIFDLVKNDRQLSKGFIKQLHQLLTRNQDSTEAMDPYGNIIEIPLLKGEFKVSENNPRRKDGSIYLYCPPIHVDSEIENLVSIYNFHQNQNLNPVILSAWLHHAFTQIHPFQDGNGRLARLLATLVLIKNGLLPFTVKREQKKEYIDALEEADNGNPQYLVTFFAKAQKKSIENAINYKEVGNQNNLNELTEIFNAKIDERKSLERIERLENISENRKVIFEYIYDIMGEIKESLIGDIPKEKAKVGVKSVMPGRESDSYFGRQIIVFANAHDYFFNKDMPRGWFKIYFDIGNGIIYDLIVSVHHFGYSDDVLAIGSFINHNRIVNGKKDEDEEGNISIKHPPHTLSLNEPINDESKTNIKAYLYEVIALGFSIIISEIN